MTFTEAAEAVLRKVGKPLHYKKITQLAIDQNLLSHVGKTPEVTMSTRLATLAKKDKGEASIVRLKPGIFGLREWGAATAADADGDEEESTTETDAAAPEATEAAVASPEEQQRAKLLEAGSQLFPEEEDDDEPVFGEKPAAEGTAEGGKRRRRRRRRGRGDRPETATAGAAAGDEAAAPAASAGDADEDEQDATATTELPAVAPGDVAAAEGAESGAVPAATAEASDAAPRAARSDDAAEAGATEESNRDARRDGRRDDRGGNRDDRGGNRDDRGGDRRDDRRDFNRDDRGGDRRDFNRDDRGGDRRDDRRDFNRDDRGGDRREAPRDETRDPGREDMGRDAADVLVSLLTRREDRQPLPLRSLIEDAVRAGRLTGDVGLLIASFSAAARMDSVRREARGERARLRLTNGRIGLMDWALGPDLVRSEADALAAVERLRDAARRQLLRRMNELPQPSFTELLLLLLERMGISSIKSARRPGLPQGEVHLAGVARRMGEELKVAVLIKRGGEIGRERVIELRGSLHHYGPAAAVWIITTGNVLSGARDEAAQNNTAPVTLIDGTALGRLMDEHAVGVRHATVAIPYLDFDLLDGLRGP